MSIDVVAVDLEYLPAPVLVGLVAREVVEVEQALHCLRPQQVVGVVRLHIEVLETFENDEFSWSSEQRSDQHRYD